MFDALLTYPIALASTAAMYGLLVLLAVPSTRVLIAPYLTHPTPPTQGYLLGFDTLRGLAAAYIALGHCRYFTWPVFQGTVGVGLAHKAVPIFAALSGFLIYRTVLRIESLEGLRDYAARRFFRIYPVYAAAVILGLAFGQYVRDGQSTFGYFLSDLLMLRILWAPAYANPVAWSLYAEIAFYAFLPLALLLVGRARFPWAVAGGVIALTVVEWHSRDVSVWAYFGYGILASELAGRLKGVSAPLFAIGVALLLIDLSSAQHDWASALGITTAHGNGLTLGLGLACLLLLATLPNLPRVGAALNVLPLRVLGVVSYSLFLIHPFYILASFPDVGILVKPALPNLQDKMPGWYLPLVFFPGAVAWAIASFLLVERPGMRFGRWLMARRQQYRAATVIAIRQAA